MAITNTVSSNLLSAFIDCLDCFLLLPIRRDKEGIVCVLK